MIDSVIPLLSATVPSSSEHTLTSDKGSNSGSAYVFEKSDSSDATSWTQVEKLTAKDGAAR